MYNACNIENNNTVSTRFLCNGRCLSSLSLSRLENLGPVDPCLSACPSLHIGLWIWAETSFPGVLARDALIGRYWRERGRDFLLHGFSGEKEGHKPKEQPFQSEMQRANWKRKIKDVLLCRAYTLSLSCLSGSRLLIGNKNGYDLDNDATHGPLSTHMAPPPSCKIWFEGLFSLDCIPPC